jgi:U3 small nucleolar RNA-associated protein 5
MPTTTSRVSAPTSLSVALEQALQTEDKEKIEAVLQTVDTDIVSQTVHRLSAAKVPTLIRELGIRLQGKPGRAANLLTWVTAVLEHHAPLLTTEPSAREALRSVYAVADARVQTFDRLLRLKGRLDLILARTGAIGATGDNSKPNGPLLVFDASKN